MRIVRLMTIVALLSTALSAQAEVKKEENSKMQLAGMLGKMVGMFGGKAADEGVRSVVALKGDRKLTRTGDTGDLVDLAEEKVYQINFKDKNFKVVTFEQMRQQMREAQEKMAKEMAKVKEEDKPQPASPQQPANVEFEYDLKESGQTKTIAGFPAREMVMTITMHEKDKKIEDTGGMALVSKIWLTPKLPGNDEIMEFDLKFYQKLASAIDIRQMQQMAAVTVSNPMMGDMMKKFAEESKRLDGTAVLTVTTFEGVQSKEQMAQAAQSGQAQKDTNIDIPAGGDKKSIAGGIFGGLARRAIQKKVEEKAADDAASSTPGHTTIMTSTSELLSISTSVTDADVAIPAGFKEKK